MKWLDGLRTTPRGPPATLSLSRPQRSLLWGDEKGLIELVNSTSREARNSGKGGAAGARNETGEGRVTVPAQPTMTFEVIFFSCVDGLGMSWMELRQRRI